ncbi:MAG: hypothetical protein R3E65_05310 [Steroidobacteraceae bacterium]
MAQAATSTEIFGNPQGHRLQLVASTKGKGLSARRHAPDVVALRNELRRQGIVLKKATKQIKLSAGGGKVKLEDVAVQPPLPRCCGRHPAGAIV